MNPNAVYNQKKVVRVTYDHEDIFKIPSNIDLENKEQVEDWWVKWNVLHIRLKGIEEVITIDSQGFEHDDKHPDNEMIEDAEDWGVEDEDFPTVDMATGKLCDPEEEECFVCHKHFTATRTRSENILGMCVGCEQYSRCDKGDCLCAGCEDKNGGKRFCPKCKIDITTTPLWCKECGWKVK